MNVVFQSGIGAVFLAASILFAPVSFAGPADNYVKNLVGKWRGGGTVTINSKGKKVRLRCTTTNTLNAATRRLSMSGRCASSNRTRPLRGTIEYSSNGSKITAVDFRIAGRSVGSNVSFNGKMLTLNASIRDEVNNKNVPSRTFIRGGGRSMSIQFQAKQAGSWQNRGTLKFRR